MADATDRFKNADEVVIRIPLPSIANRGILYQELTYNEVHAMVIGLSGFLFATVWESGDQIYTAPLVLILPAYAIIGHPVLAALPHDDENYQQTIGLKTISCEPWWFLFVYTLTFVIAITV